MSRNEVAEGMNSLDLPGRPADTRVVVAMSGGVDSSVVAGLLRREGYEVIGITLQLYDHGRALSRGASCCAGRDIHDARRVAEQLGIAHYVLDYESRFRDSVIDEFADSYLNGETPVPCIRCNQQVKFTDLLGMAKDLGAQALATGHYAVTRLENGRRRLARGRDLDRDQSYFLFATTQRQLDFLRMPLGCMTKAQTRALARDLGLDVADKPDSQDICFVPHGDYARVIERLRPEAGEPGDIVHLDGRRLGRHRGIVHFTIGQRRGLGIATGEPLHVLAIDAASRIVTVGPRDALFRRHIRLRDVNWLGLQPLDEMGADGLAVHARIRSTQEPVGARLLWRDGAVEVELSKGEYGISPGQACVLYAAADADATVLGGGWIDGVGDDADDCASDSAARHPGQTVSRIARRERAYEMINSDGSDAVRDREDRSCRKLYR